MTPTLVRLWADGYGSAPITAFVDDWDNGSFTIDSAHPFSRPLWELAGNPGRGLSAPLTVYSTEEIEWVVDRVECFRYRDDEVRCMPRRERIRRSLISDDYLIWLWLEAEKGAVDGSEITA